MKDPEQKFSVTRLLGLVSGHYDIEQKARVTGDSLFGEVHTAINSGIAIITPAHEIKNLLDREDVVAKRAAP